MALIVGVHGISQQLRGPEVLRAVWAPALRDGVWLAGARPPDEADVEIAFYGDLFRAKARKAVGAPLLTAADVADGFEADLLEAWWLAAAFNEGSVPGPDTRSKLRTSSRAQRALNALSQSRFFSGLTEHLIIRFIKQVCLYLTDDRIRAEIQARVVDVVGAGTSVLVGHSLGSVVAYEAACAHPGWDVALVTLGCPLGVRNLVFERIRPPAEHGRGQFPAGAATWTNIADDGDVVALVKRLAPLFGDQVRDLLVHNGSKAHDVSPYLTAAETGRAIAEGLARHGDG